MDDHIQLKDSIEGLIKRVRLDEYAKEGEIEREEFPKGKPPYKTVEMETNGKDKEANKGKRRYIIIISWGVPRENFPSKGPMKRKIVKILVVHKNGGGTSA